MEQVPLKPLFERSMQQGVGYGILYTVMSACLLWSMKVPELSVLFLLLGAGGFMYMPVSLAWVTSYNRAYRRMAPIWMSGIVQTLCGALICSLLTALYLIFVADGFLSEYVHEMIRRLTEINSKADTSQLMVPTVMQFIGSMFWATSFSGSVISLLLGIILPRIAMFDRLTERLKRKYSTHER